MCPQAGEGGTTRPFNPGWGDHKGLVHALLAAPDRSISFSRRLEVHDRAAHDHTLEYAD